jgi:DNA-binding NarL/FixJ family response regulator
MRVFIADDSSLVVERLAGLLDEVSGVEFVGHAADVKQAVDDILELKPDALILDLHMPGGSGLDVLRALRSLHLELPVIICTNYSDSEYRDECLSAGANFFLDKSTEFEKIPSILRGLMRKKSKVSVIAR